MPPASPGCHQPFRNVSLQVLGCLYHHHGKFLIINLFLSLFSTLALCYWKALTNADAAAPEFFCVELGCLRVRADRLDWSKQECGKKRMKRIQGRSEGKGDYENEIDVNGEGNKVSQQAQVEGNGRWLCPPPRGAAIIHVEGSEDGDCLPSS